MKPIDFTIIRRPAYITFTCPHCEQDQRVNWKDVPEPDYWDEDWGSVKCPDCGEEVKLGDYDMD